MYGEIAGTQFRIDLSGNYFWGYYGTLDFSGTINNF